MNEFNYVSNLDEVTDFDKEYEIYWYGKNVTVKEDKEKYYIDTNTGLGVGVYEKEDWSLDEAIYDQTHCGDDSYYNINTLDDLADCCEIFGRTAVKEDIARAVERNGWEWKKDDWLCHLISDGKRTLKVYDTGEAEFDEEDDDEEDEYDDYGTY